MRRRRVLAGLAALPATLLGCASVTFRRSPASTRAELDERLAALCDDPERPLASLSTLAIRGGETVYEGQFGRRHIGRTAAQDKPANRRTLYRIASISKLVTTLGVMRLVEERRLALDTDIGEYLGWRLRNPHSPDVPVTLRMLLTHTSSLRDEGGYSWGASVSLRDVLVPGGTRYGAGAMWSSGARPGAWFSYANMPWGVVGTAMECATGERFDRLVKRLVLDPLGMSGGFEPAEFPADRLDDLATLYRKRSGPDGKEVWDPAGPWMPQVDDYESASPVHRAASGYVVGTNGTLFGPQGNLRASAADLGNVMRMLMARGQHEGAPFLQAASVDQMLSAQWRSLGSNGNSTYGTGRQRMNAWGLGVQHFTGISGQGFGDRLVEGGGFPAVGHHGDAWGLNGILAFDPATRDGIIFLCGGPGFDPALEPGAYSAFHRYEERIMTTLHRGVIR